MLKNPLFVNCRLGNGGKRWVSAKEIARHFDMDHCKAINTVSYILSEVKKLAVRPDNSKSTAGKRLPVSAPGARKKY
jgi:hypothetical protein